MGFNNILFLALLIPQLIIVGYFNEKNIQNTGKNNGSFNTATAVQGLIFALTITIVSPFILYNQYTLGGNNTVETDLILHFALSFFATHIVFILAAKNITSEITHHLICMSALIYSLTTQTLGQDLLLTIFLGEMTFTHYAKIIAKNLNKKRLEYILNEAFIRLFSIARLVIFPVYLYFFMIYANTPIIPKFLAMAFVGLGIYYNLIVLRKYIKSKQMLSVLAA